MTGDVLRKNCYLSGEKKFKPRLQNRIKISDENPSLFIRKSPRASDQPEYLLSIISMMFRIASSTDDPMLWNQSFGFEEALISCSEEVLMKPGESKLENRTIKQADGNFTRYV